MGIDSCEKDCKMCSCTSQTECKILQAAIDLCATKGFAETSMNEIAARVGVTKPVIYYYFKNKEHLFVAIVKLCFETLLDLAQEQVMPHKTIQGFVTAYISMMFALANDHKQHMTIMYVQLCGLVQTIPEIREIVMDFGKRVHNFLMQGYAGCSDIRDFDEEQMFDAVSMLFGVVDVQIRWMLKGEIELTEDRAKRLAELVVNGLSK